MEELPVVVFGILRDDTTVAVPGILVGHTGKAQTVTQPEMLHLGYHPAKVEARVVTYVRRKVVVPVPRPPTKKRSKK